MAVITVRPGDDEIKHSLVACWDQDAEHLAADPAWEHFGGAYIVGDPKHPEKTYAVEGTSYVYGCIQKGRLVKVADAVEPTQPDTTRDGDGGKKRK